MFVAEACHSDRFISPPPAQEIAPSAEPPEVRLARSMRGALDGWDRLSAKKRIMLNIEAGAALAILGGGLPERTAVGTLSVNPNRVRKLLEVARG